jgi:small acid-soluble spore protein E (minor gamma-type SASP)
MDKNQLKGEDTDMGGDFNMAKKPTAGTDVQKVRAQNQAAEQGVNAEFASETNAAEVRKQNQQSEANK